MSFLLISLNVNKLKNISKGNVWKLFGIYLVGSILCLWKLRTKLTHYIIDFEIDSNPPEALPHTDTPQFRMTSFSYPISFVKLAISCRY